MPVVDDKQNKSKIEFFSNILLKFLLKSCTNKIRVYLFICDSFILIIHVGSGDFFTTSSLIGNVNGNALVT